MGRAPCCDKVGLKKGPWTSEEDQTLLAYIEQHGHGSWRSLPGKAGLQRCGKSCRLRWANYLRPDIKRGKFSIQEEQTIIQLHALLGNRWSAIATHLPKRTDNEIKNYWNTHIKKRLNKMGIDPITHKPKNETLSSTTGPSKSSANLSHIAQWESARLEAEARLARQSKLLTKPDLPLARAKPPTSVPPCLDILKAWNGTWWKPPESGSSSYNLESPTSTLTFSNIIVAPNSGYIENLPLFTHSLCFMESAGVGESVSENQNDNENANDENFMVRFTELLLNNSDATTPSEAESGDGNDIHNNKNYWNSILNLADFSPSDPSVF